ncbi:putative bifunctional diguanylate cyclase/phosphodiesterase [Endothiovibrio diazotrophicus]
MPRFNSIKHLILAAALLVSLLLFGGLYAVISALYDHSARADAEAVSSALAQQTFTAMFQIMRRGWSRQDVEGFLGSMRETFRDTPYELEIYRGPRVEALFGPIEQPPLDSPLRTALADGKEHKIAEERGLRYLHPLVARDECLRCHVNARVGDTLGVIEVRQDLRPMLEKARGQFLSTLGLIAPAPFIVALLVALFINRRLDRSIGRLRQGIARVNRVSDLQQLEMPEDRQVFSELQVVLDEVSTLVKKLRTFAVDKELLEFEIRLLERFVITSEVVRDWREYVKRLLLDINAVIEAYSLFSMFKVDEELFDLEVFWHHPPSRETVRLFEEVVREKISQHNELTPALDATIHHHIADPDGPELSLTVDEIRVQTKSLLVEAPKIGGIVGIGVQAGTTEDSVKLLVVESILSTLLNVVGSVKAISKYTKDLEYYATRDPLTDLVNQRVFWDLMDHETARSEAYGHKFALLVIDLDNFKAVNDSHGHAMGDQLLRAFADAIKELLRKGDVLARYGGDEFVVLMSEIDGEEVIKLADAIVRTAGTVLLPAPDGSEIKASSSVGVAVYPDHAQNGRDLFLFADNMMYRAKAEGKNRAAFPGESDVLTAFREIAEKCTMVSKALDESRVVPFFQPILRSKSGELHACEVLSRIHTEGGRVAAAGEFVEAAERMGLIHNLDFAVMEKAFAAARAVNYRGTLFINISPRALVLSEFFPKVRKMVGDQGIEPSNVVFELTERETVTNLQVLEKFVANLQMEGFKFAIDDFGSGFSSFHYIKRFPIDYIKIEGDFIANMLRDERDRAFVNSIATLARELDIRTVAEYIEDGEILEAVARCGIDYAQGYHLGRPLADLGEAMRVTHPPT